MRDTNDLVNLSSRDQRRVERRREECEQFPLFCWLKPGWGRFTFPHLPFWAAPKLAWTREASRFYRSISSSTLQRSVSAMQKPIMN